MDGVGTQRKTDGRRTELTRRCYAEARKRGRAVNSSSPPDDHLPSATDMTSTLDSDSFVIPDSLPPLPVELRREILSLCDRGTLATACRVSLAFLEMAAALLYTHLVVDRHSLPRLLYRRVSQPHSLSLGFLISPTERHLFCHPSDRSFFPSPFRRRPLPLPRPDPLVPLHRSPLRFRPRVRDLLSSTRLGQTTSGSPPSLDDRYHRR